MNWEPGDLALCTRGGQLINLGLREHPVAGRVYIVEAAQPNVIFADGSAGALVLANGPPNNSGIARWWQGRFIRITPEEPDEFDLEVIADSVCTPSPLIVEPAQ